MSCFLRSLFFAFALAQVAGLQAQNVVVSGFAPGAEGKRISIKSYTDFFTGNEETLASGIIDSGGRFTLRCKVHETIPAVVHIEYYTGDLYLQPNRNYEVEVRNLVFNEKLDKVNYNINPFYCTIKVASEGPDGLNNLIRRLNISYNTFIRDNVMLLNTREILPKADTFLMAVKDTFGNVNDPYFNDYLNYRMASFKLLTSYTDGYKLLLDYFFRKPILYNNIEYFTFFNDCFENYFKDLTHELNLSDLYVPVVKNKSLSETLDVMGRDTLFRNEVFRELVLIKTLDMLYAQPGYNRQAVSDMLLQIAQASKTDKHRKIARSVYASRTRFNTGMPAPDFRLRSVNDSMVSLSDFKGKTICLNFFTTWNTACLDELELMRKLYERSGHRIVFISIGADRGFMTLFHFVREKKYPWIFLHLDSDYDLPAQFAAFAYPSFAIIGADGRFIRCPAPRPSENLEKLLNETAP